MENKTGIITNVLPKFKKDGKSVYLNIEMQDGFRVNNFNAMPGDFEIGDTVEYSGETPEGGKYWNLDDMHKSDKEVAVEKPGEVTGTKTFISSTNGLGDAKSSKDTSMYTSYAKDIFNDLTKIFYEKSIASPHEETMQIAIALVKQAKEAF